MVKWEYDCGFSCLFVLVLIDFIFDLLIILCGYKYVLVIND